MPREQSIQFARNFFDSGHFLRGLNDLIHVPTESQNPERSPYLYEYLNITIPRKIEPLGFSWVVYDNPISGSPPFMIAERIEDPQLTTVLLYGHGDVVLGMEGKWKEEMDPWEVTEKGDYWFGRGTADNKGQHWTALSALLCLLQSEGKLGFNVKFLLEMGEETGSKGLEEFCAEHKDQLKSDVLIASDGPRLRLDRPSIYMGSRGNMNFSLSASFREGAVHSGNWGGVVKDPAIRLAHAISTITDENGCIQIDGWRPKELPDVIRKALEGCHIGGSDEGVFIDEDWGEPGLTPAERLYGWNNFAVISLASGNIAKPVNAIQSHAEAICQLRYVVGTDPKIALDHLRRHLDEKGFQDIQIKPAKDSFAKATRLDPNHPWVDFVASSIERTIDQPLVRLPNLAGSLPNDCFSETLGLPTVWIPHSYPGCSQHAPNEHALKSILREGLEIMTGLYWDIGFAKNAIPSSNHLSK